MEKYNESRRFIILIGKINREFCPILLNGLFLPRP